MARTCLPLGEGISLAAPGIGIFFRSGACKQMTMTEIALEFCTRYCVEWTDNALWCETACPLRLFDLACLSLASGKTAEHVFAQLDMQIQNVNKATVADYN